MTVDEKVNGEISKFALDIEIASDYYSAYLILRFLMKKLQLLEKILKIF